MQEQDSFQYAHQISQPRKRKNKYTLSVLIMINQSILNMYLTTSNCGEFVNIDEQVIKQNCNEFYKYFRYAQGSNTKQLE